MTFSEILFAAAARRRLRLPPGRHPEPLAVLDYPRELVLKQEALEEFWREHALPGRPEPLTPALSPRGYRTTTKRRALRGAGGINLTFPGYRRTIPGVAPSALDLPEHLPVYSFLLDRLRRPAARPLASVLNWVIVRGGAGRLTVILNLKALNARVVRAAKQAAESLKEADLGVAAAFLYIDPSESRYFLEARRPEDMVAEKHLFGPGLLEVEALGVTLRFPPTVFSQVNGAMIETMAATVRGLLSPLEGCSLLDLYCGFGLFGLSAGQEAAEILGVDSDGPAVRAARVNAGRLGWGPRAKYLPGRIDGAFLARRLDSPKGRQAVLLDPPRQGTADGVVEALAAREPVRAVHVCCGTDEIPKEVAAWERSGYHLERAVPLDLFAGTAGLETMLLFLPGSGERPPVRREAGRTSAPRDQDSQERPDGPRKDGRRGGPRKEGLPRGPRTKKHPAPPESGKRPQGERERPEDRRGPARPYPARPHPRDGRPRRRPAPGEDAPGR